MAKYYNNPFLIGITIGYRPASARGFDVGGTASRFQWHTASHIKTSPTDMQLTTLKMDHCSGACQGHFGQHHRWLQIIM
jgi:hypothetical protein